MTLEYAKEGAYQLDVLKGLEKQLQPLISKLDKPHSRGEYKFSSLPVVAKELPIQDGKRLADLYRKEVIRGEQTKEYGETIYIYDTSVKIETTDTVDSMSGTSESTARGVGGDETEGDTVVTSVRIDAKGQVELTKHIQ